MAPVAGSPPKRGETMLATPCAMSSILGLCLSLLMRSETTADIRDSMAPSIATVKAGEILDGGAHAGDSQKNKQDAGHDSARKQAVYSIFGDDSGNHDNESAGGAANLSFRPAQRGDEKSGDNGAVNARLWGNA